MTQCPTEWKTFTLRFHTQVNVPQKPRAVFKNNNTNHKPPKNQSHFYTDQFLPSHAHFQGHMGWGKIVHPAKVVFSVCVNVFLSWHIFLLGRVKKKKKVKGKKKCNYGKFQWIKTFSHWFQNFRQNFLKSKVYFVYLHFKSHYLIKECFCSKKT